MVGRGHVVVNWRVLGTLLSLCAMIAPTSQRAPRQVAQEDRSMQCWSGRGPRAAVGVAVLGLLALAPRPVAACMVDNIPSITASGRIAVFSAAPSGPINPAHYAPFMIPGLFGTGWTVHFGERNKLLRLPARLLNAPWRWEFGDGTISHGHALTHVYRTPGDYVVTVAAEVAGEP